MQKPEQKNYLTPPRLGQKLVIWGFYPSEAIALIALSIGSLFIIFQSLFAHTWLIAFPIAFAILKIRIGEDKENLEKLLKIRIRYLKQSQTFTLLECFEGERKGGKRV